MTTVEVLKAARDLISDPAKWTTKAFARDTKGNAVVPYSTLAVRFCAYGAIDHVCQDDPVTKSMALAQLGRVSVRGIVHTNDIRGHQAILAAFDKAIMVSQ